MPTSLYISGQLAGYAGDEEMMMLSPEESNALSALIGASSGALIQLITFFVSRHDKRKEEKNGKLNDIATAVVGLDHDRITCLGQKYIDRGYVTQNEYENLIDYLYNPYKKLGGNGTAEKVVNEVKQLPLKEDHDEK